METLTIKTIVSDIWRTLNRTPHPDASVLMETHLKAHVEFLRLPRRSIVIHKTLVQPHGTRNATVRPTYGRREPLYGMATMCLIATAILETKKGYNSAL